MGPYVKPTEMMLKIEKSLEDQGIGTNDHWKAGDGLNAPDGRYIIGSLVLVNHKDGSISIRFYDSDGVDRGGVENLIPRADVKLTDMLVPIERALTAAGDYLPGEIDGILQALNNYNE